MSRMRMSFVAAAALVLLLLLVVQPPPSSASSYAPQCKIEYTSLALLSCQETSPVAPTRSCCDALLYAIDTWPSSVVDKGVCCLCVYMLARAPSFDLPRAYITCGGKDSASVAQWLQQQQQPNCDDPCGLDSATASPPPPSSSGGSKHGQLGLGVIIAIVAGAVIGALLLGWCVYGTFFGPAAKERQSPDPSFSGVEMTSGSGRMSSARHSISTLL
ncbi:hypothetical protein ACP70R_035943 [Stipagrostis hirtigluma subsp. patula]